MGRDLQRLPVVVGADRAEPLTLRPQRVGHRSEQPFDFGREGIGGQIDVVGRRVERLVAGQLQIAHDTADQVDAVTGVDEPPRHRIDDPSQGLQSRQFDHRPGLPHQTINATDGGGSAAVQANDIRISSSSAHGLDGNVSTVPVGRNPHDS